MTAVQTALRLALRQQQTLDAAIAAANDLLVANNDEEMFATLFCAVIDIATELPLSAIAAIPRRSSCAQAEAPIASHHRAYRLDYSSTRDSRPSR